jgi:hypothetical protein
VPGPGRPVPAALTCGAVGEDAGNNRLMARTCRRGATRGAA